jgi:hypothetical protein
VPTKLVKNKSRTPHSSVPSHNNLKNNSQREVRRKVPIASRNMERIKVHSSTASSCTYRDVLFMRPSNRKWSKLRCLPRRKHSAIEQEKMPRSHALFYSVGGHKTALFVELPSDPPPLAGLRQMPVFVCLDRLVVE